VFGIGSGGAAELAHVSSNIEGLVHLGYPVYFIMIIGTWKVLGATALLLPRFPRLKEWAYAGIFFNMTGAAVSNAVMGNAAWHVVVDLIFVSLVVASWALRPQSRTLGVLFPSTTPESASDRSNTASQHR
jgi:DoxX-like family